jgi:hypothetical protein
MSDEKALMDVTTSTKLVVVHFFHPDFNRCRIMDGHLEVSSIAPITFKLCNTFLISISHEFFRF